jgi:hypothetical protein
VVRTALNAGASWWRRRARELPLFDDDMQLGIAPGTVRAHLARAVAALRRELAHADTTEAEPCPTTI